MSTGRLRRLAGRVGPGIITGAADDDPSGIATYSIAGAQLGTGLLWTALFTWPLMAAVQMMCARIGMVTGRGLMGTFRQRLPRRLLVPAAAALLLANTINIGADLSGMADAAELLTRFDSRLWVVLFGVAITWGVIGLNYAAIARVLKWLAASLLAYVVAGILIRPPWGEVAHAAVIPSWPRGRDGWGTLVAVLGTTISPYLFFWQASEEVEEEKAGGRTALAQRRGATATELRERRLDVLVGSFFSAFVQFFIILTTAFTLHRHGITELHTSREVAEALRPLAGRFATLVYSLGLVAVGLLAIPTLSGSAAYACAEIFSWREGMSQRFRGARSFYLVMAIATAAGMAMELVRLSPVKALYWAAIINGLLAPPLLAVILVVAVDRSLMVRQPSPALERALVAVTAVLMTAAAVAMFVV
jgi:Mn2+/Fe2+ NRAMP family transporter